MRQNIELKAHLPNLARAHEVARQLGAEQQALQQQTDTYFTCNHGRLKLREIADQQAQLIWYARANQAESKLSNYTLVPVAEAALLKTALSHAQGVWLVVEKHREIFLWQNVRIHFDQVAELGTFLEFEAVLGREHTEQEGHWQLAYLSEQFGIEESHLMDGSYSDLLAHKLGLIE